METASNSSQKYEKKENTAQEGVGGEMKAYRKELCSLGCSLHLFLPTQQTLSWAQQHGPVSPSPCSLISVQ